MKLIIIILLLWFIDGVDKNKSNKVKRVSSELPTTPVSNAKMEEEDILIGPSWVDDLVFTEDFRFFYVRNIQCSNKNCQPPNTCVDKKTCKCFAGRANFTPPGSHPSPYYCQYYQKKQLVAFLLETMIALGTGHFYTGRVNAGLFKLLICVFPIMIGIIFFCVSITMKSDNDCLEIISIVMTCIFACIALIWQLVDMVNFGANNYKDGNGVPLEPW